jgi:predicted RNase H-like nuclease (RuvC/YqgF family)
VERLKQHVVALADEVARLAHEREVLQAEVNRVTQDREIESRRTRELSEIIKKYIEAKWEDTGLAVPSIRPLEVEISRQLR